LKTLHNIIKKRWSVFRKRLFSNDTHGVISSSKPVQSLWIQASAHSPHISFDISINLFEIKGNALDNATQNFFTPVVAWVKHFVEQNTYPIELNIELTKLNKEGFEGILGIVEVLSDYCQNVKIPLHITWVANNDALAEYGEYLRARFTHLPIMLRAKVSI
jgi:hypothetical protein